MLIALGFMAGSVLCSGTGASGGDIYRQMNGSDESIEVDCLGLLCPLPVLRARKRMRGMQSGQVLRLLASDPMAAVDVPHFCDQAGHLYLGAETVPGGSAYLMRHK